ncbi:hypothetical protein MBH78_03870 [Oceanimonas sp. NS1]|nr:hypothetical protein [Oceanimonas sp. NS1]
MNWKHSLAGLLLISGTTLAQAETLKTPYWLEYNGKESSTPSLPPAITMPCRCCTTGWCARANRASRSPPGQRLECQ